MDEKNIEMLQNKDISLVLFTYKTSELPENKESAVKEIKKYIRMVRKYEDQKKIPKCKYFTITHLSIGGRWHHHVVFVGVSEIEAICALWKKGLWHCQEIRSPEMKEELLFFWKNEKKRLRKGKCYGLIYR